MGNKEDRTNDEVVLTLKSSTSTRAENLVSYTHSNNTFVHYATIIMGKICFRLVVSIKLGMCWPVAGACLVFLN